MARNLLAQWRSWLNRILFPRPSRPRRPWRQRPMLEVLEDRQLLSAIVVNTAADDPNGSTVGQTTLRDAINAANASNGSITEIDFAIGTQGSLQTINIGTTALPSLTAKGVYINGFSQGGAGNTLPLIEVAGSGALGQEGLLLFGANSKVSGLFIQGFTNGLDLEGASATVSGDVLSGNSQGGLLVGGGASGALVQGNFVGTNAAGSNSVANGLNGILVIGNNVTIGGTTTGAANVISANGGDGILINRGTTGT